MKRLRFIYIFLVFLAVFSVKSIANDDVVVEKTKMDDNPPLALRGADIKDVSRLVFDGIPQNRYKVVPLNNQINIIFEDFEYSFLKEDLLAIGLLKNIKKLSVIKKDNFTILNIEYKCPCQGDFYKWHNQKLVLDVFSLDAVSNPLKIQDDVTGETENKKKITQASDEKEKQNKKTETDKSQENVSPDFEKYLKTLIAEANEKGIVEFKNSVKEKLNISEHENLLEKKGILSDNSKLEIKKDNLIIQNKDDSVQNIHVSNKNILSVEETEKLLPTDTNMFLDNTGLCLPDGAFKLPPNNPEHDTFYDKISDYRNNLIGEFDVVNPENALKLAMHYISYGLGEEALQVLSNFPTPEQRGHIAKSMAELLTNRKLSDNSIFKNVEKCRGVQKIWGAYRYFKLGDEDKSAQMTNSSEIADILKTLPAVLQSQIGSSLALNLVRQDAYKTASEIIDAIATGKGQFDPNVLLVRGFIDAKNGLADRALKALEDVVDRTHGVDQQMAGLALAELKLASDISLTQRDISILEEVIFLKARELIGVQALALIAENEARYKDFNKAFKRLSQKVYYNPQIKDPAEIKAEQLFKRIAVSGESNDNPHTLSIYWDYPKLIPQKPVYLKAFAERLFERGYDNGTIQVINHMQEKFPHYTDNNDVTFLKGKAFFRQGKYAETIQEMNMPYDTDVEYMRLKAEAFHKLGDNKKAMALIDKFDDKISILAKARYALDANEWDIVSKDYEKAKNLAKHKSNEFYYRAKASAYMSGFQYPGTASQYKKPEDVVFHQPNRQAKGIENIVNETKKLIELIEKRSHKINNIIYQKNVMNHKSEVKTKNG